MYLASEKGGSRNMMINDHIVAVRSVNINFDEAISPTCRELPSPSHERTEPKFVKIDLAYRRHIFTPKKKWVPDNADSDPERREYFQMHELR
jgi:hypothetical protein